MIKNVSCGYVMTTAKNEKEEIMKNKINERLVLGIDEFTLVLFSPNKTRFDLWHKKAEKMILIFLRLSGLLDMQEQIGTFVKGAGGYVKGYSHGYSISNKPWYASIAYNDDPNMGVCFRFSALAYSYYRTFYESLFGTEINIHSFLQLVDTPEYTIRLSRIDFTADYFDYPSISKDEHQFLTVDEIYKKYLTKNIIAVNDTGRECAKTTSAISNNELYSTIYMGSKGRNNKRLIRIYDKRLEQIKTSGSHSNLALNCKSWIRLELKLSHAYAHNLTEVLLNISSTEELQSYIAKVIIEKIRFIETESLKNLKISEDILKISASVKNKVLVLEKPKDNSLYKSLNYLLSDSGLMSNLYKIQKVWSEKEVKFFLNYIEDYFFNYFLKETDKSNNRQETKLFIAKHKDLLKSYDFKKYLNGEYS